MTKLQKVFLWLGLGLFLIPEILWSPIINEAITPYYLWKNPAKQLWRYSTIFDSKNLNVLINVVFTQFVGLVLIFIILLLSRRMYKNKILLMALFAIVFLLIVYVYSLLDTFQTFNPKLTL